MEQIMFVFFNISFYHAAVIYLFVSVALVSRVLYTRKIILLSIGTWSCLIK